MTNNLNATLNVGDKTIRLCFDDIEQFKLFEESKEASRIVEFLQDVEAGKLHISNERNRFVYKEAVDYVRWYEHPDNKTLTAPNHYSSEADTFCDMIYDNFNDDWLNNNLSCIGNKDVCYYWCKAYCKQFEDKIKSYQVVYDFTVINERPFCNSYVFETEDEVVSKFELHSQNDKQHDVVIVDRKLKEVKEKIF